MIFIDLFIEFIQRTYMDINPRNLSFDGLEWRSVVDLINKLTVYWMPVYKTYPFNLSYT